MIKNIVYLILLFSFLYAEDFSVKTSGNLETSFINSKEEHNTFMMRFKFINSCK